MLKWFEIRGQIAAAEVAGVSVRAVKAACRVSKADKRRKKLTVIRVERQVTGPPMHIYDWREIVALWPHTAKPLPPESQQQERRSRLRGRPDES